MDKKQQSEDATRGADGAGLFRHPLAVQTSARLAIHQRISGLRQCPVQAHRGAERGNQHSYRDNGTDARLFPDEPASWIRAPRSQRPPSSVRGRVVFVPVIVLRQAAHFHLLDVQFQSSLEELDGSDEGLVVRLWFAEHSNIDELQGRPASEKKSALPTSPGARGSSPLLVQLVDRLCRFVVVDVGRQKRASSLVKTTGLAMAT